MREVEISTTRQEEFLLAKSRCASTSFSSQLLSIIHICVIRKDESTPQGLLCVRFAGTCLERQPGIICSRCAVSLMFLTSLNRLSTEIAIQSYLDYIPHAVKMMMSFCKRSVWSSLLCLRHISVFRNTCGCCQICTHVLLGQVRLLKVIGTFAIHARITYPHLLCIISPVSEELDETHIPPYWPAIQRLKTLSQ